MAQRAGTANLPLHGGQVPKWLADRMTRLGAVIGEAIVHHYGRDELLRRLAHAVIDAAIRETGTVGIGRVPWSRRERLVMVEPRGAGIVAITLRASEEVRPPAFGTADM